MNALPPDLDPPPTPPPTPAPAQDCCGAELMTRRVVPVWQRQVEAARVTADEGLGGVLHSLGAAAEALASASQALHALDSGAPAAQALAARLATLREHFELLLMGLQFGDRLNQMLDLVGADMARFVGWLQHDAAARSADAAQWLAALEARYTMPEQRARHHGSPEGAAAASSAAAAPASSIEFF